MMIAADCNCIFNSSLIGPITTGVVGLITITVNIVLAHKNRKWTRQHQLAAARNGQYGKLIDEFMLVFGSAYKVLWLIKDKTRGFDINNQGVLKSINYLLLNQFNQSASATVGFDTMKFLLAFDDVVVSKIDELKKIYEEIDNVGNISADIHVSDLVSKIRRVESVWDEIVGLFAKKLDIDKGSLGAEIIRKVNISC